MIQNMLEQFPGDEMIAAANEARQSDTGFMIRVPHSSGMLEGKYTAETVFPESDHRRHRPRSWLINGLKKIETLDFLVTPERTLGQAALQWLLAEPRVMSVLPNIYDREQLIEFAGAPRTPALTADELHACASSTPKNFGVREEPMKYKGTMTPPQSSARRRAVAHAARAQRRCAGADRSLQSSDPQRRLALLQRSDRHRSGDRQADRGRRRGTDAPRPGQRCGAIGRRRLGARAGR